MTIGASTTANTTEVVIYKGSKGDVVLNADIKNDTIWATQDQIAGLFGVQRPAITKHINNIYKTGELKEQSVSSILELTVEVAFLDLMNVDDDICKVLRRVI